ASLIGDYFAPHERGRVYGFVLAGEMVGAAMGLMVSGGLAGVTWRLGFWWLAAVGVALAVLIGKMLPEPARGGQSRIPVGAEKMPSPDQKAAESTDDPADAEERDSTVADEVATQRVPPHDDLVLRENPQNRSLWWAVRYVLKVRTNVVLITASALGYFFLTGLGTFGVALMRGRFGFGQFEATLLSGVIGSGSLLGVLVSGRIADWRVGSGHISARITVVGVAMLTAVTFAVPALTSHTAGIMVACAFVAAIGLGGANPPLDAARLDIMHSRLWGRAEAVRTVLRAGLTSIAPLLFGYVSTQLGGPRSASVGDGGKLGSAGTNASGIAETFLIMLVPLFIAAVLILFVARRTYPRDVATAVASEQADGS
ncbi:MAG TPA: MFS transporter, partial [Propionibacteriaceae bacterium]|nr:MFS transporter [Propionibacteriaceae bacterium]